MVRVRKGLRKPMAAGAVLAAVMSLTATPATASTINTHGTSHSFIFWTLGDTAYVQRHVGDDLGFAISPNGGITVDMRWQNCAGTQSGLTQFKITPGAGRRVLGTDFRAGACLKIQYRTHLAPGGSFVGSTYWNMNFA